MRNVLHINEINCKSIVNPSNISDIKYTINPYIGCSHGCLFCYARFMCKFTNHNMEWGTFVDVKINAVEILKKQLKKLKTNKIMLSTVTDPYQPIETKYKLTRNILIELLNNNFSVSILTRSNLILRDIDILKKFNKNNLEIGFSINTYNEAFRKDFEPNASPIYERIKALKILKSNNIKVWVFIAPVLPYLTKISINSLLDEIKDYADTILVDKLNIKCGNWKAISYILTKKYPELLSKWQKLFFNNNERKINYHKDNKQLIDFCTKNKVDLQFC